MPGFPEELKVLGWREWAALPDLGIRRIKCKVDTGARTSTLHAFFVRRFVDQGQPRVCFGIHPLQRRMDMERTCTADLVDQRMVCNSGGHREKRYIIRTPIIIGDRRWPIELTLTARDTMRFRMLLGRTAIHRRFLVNPAASYLAGAPKLPDLTTEGPLPKDLRP